MGQGVEEAVDVCEKYYIASAETCMIPRGQLVQKCIGCTKNPTSPIKKQVENCRNYNVGASDYSKHKIQPWDIWFEYKLNPWDADIVKRTLRTKSGESRRLEYEKIKHICDERIRQIDAGL